MDKGILQRYSVWAKENLEQQIEVSLKTLGINSDTDIAKARRTGDVTTIEGDPNSYSADLYANRELIVNLVKTNGYKNVIEEFAYTWFNRFVALRFMEVHDFLGHGFRVLSNRSGGVEPEILQNIGFVKDDLKLKIDYCSTLREQNKIEELYRYVIIQQCNALSNILPMLFSQEMSYLELLLPKTLLRGDTAITKILEIPEEAFLEDVEIIGWMYQFYISSKKDVVNKEKKIITKDTLPAVTQLFTPDWIVRYMAENSVGRIWMESYPSSSLHSEMKYYIDDIVQTEEVQRKLDEIKYRSVNPEDIRIIEPCCGSGHILVYVFDLLYKMYEEKGYPSRDIPTLILSKNLYGLDVDKRAAQLSSFALVMKARVVNNRFFSDKYYISPNIYEITDASHLTQMQYKKHLGELKLLSDIELKEIDNLVDLFKNGKTIGSLLKITGVNLDIIDNALRRVDSDAINDIFNTAFLTDGMKELKHLSKVARILSSKYDVMITNPPYIGISSMETPVKNYAVKNYPNSKADMFAMFMETSFVKRKGFISMINMHSWMFLETYYQLRDSILHTKTIESLVHLGPHAFETIGGEIVQTTSFILRNYVNDKAACYIRLVGYDNAQMKEEQFHSIDNRYYCKSSNYMSIPMYPLSYWIGENYYDIFRQFDAIGKYGETKKGVLTGNDKRFVRLWFEVSNRKIGRGIKDHEDMIQKNYKWIPATGGGVYRKWYGNFENVINMENDAYEIRNNTENSCRLREPKYYFQQCTTWSEVSGKGLSMRYVPQGVLFGNSGPVCFWKSHIFYWLGLMNSSTTMKFMAFLSPTLTFGPEQIKRVPCKIDDMEHVENIVEQCVKASKIEWDSFETSWDFGEHPLVRWSRELWDGTSIGASMHYYYGYHPAVNGSLDLCYMLWQGECQDRFNKLKANEEELNRIFIDIYGLQDELNPEVEDRDITVRLANKERDIKSLISYFVGVIMGRYSLSKEGLQYAGGEWDMIQYGEPMDDDGIVPVYSTLGMEDSLTTKIIKLVKMVFGDDDYRNNIDFIADALGKKSNESSEETLNRYLNEGFYADHLKIYQKKPIYWMFSSGKNNGFKCLIYMHRYNSDTLASINGKYFLPESTRIKNELDEINSSIASSEGRDRIRLEKERQKLAAKYNEAIEYGQVLDHMANRFIGIDLDDGVKVNYAKFQGIELVTDNGTKIKKDLLVPIK